MTNTTAVLLIGIGVIIATATNRRAIIFAGAALLSAVCNNIIYRITTVPAGTPADLDRSGLIEMMTKSVGFPLLAVGFYAMAVNVILRYWPDDSNARPYIDSQVAKANRRLLAVNSIALPVLIVWWFKNSPHSGTYWDYCAAAAELLAVRNLLVWCKRMALPRSHPIYGRLARYGELDQVREEIHSEIGDFRSSEEFTVCREANLRLGVMPTRNWFFAPTEFGLDIYHIRDVVWAYQVETSYYLNGAYRGDGQSVTLMFRDGGRAVARPSANTDHHAFVSWLMLRVRSQTPHAVIGFSQERKQMWHWRRKAFLALADQDKRN